MNTIEAEKEYTKGLKALLDGNTPAAMVCFEKAALISPRPVYLSSLGYCIAKERGQVQKGMLLCSEAMESEPGNTVHYLNLGKIYLVAGNRQEAIRIFRNGLGHGPDKEITAQLDAIGTRSSVLFSSLSRSNPLNRYLGLILRKLGIR